MKAKQIGFQLLRKFYKPRYKDLACTHISPIELHWPTMWTQARGLMDDTGLSFTYLNQKVTFEDCVNWNYAKNGKLWTYNLNYFEHLSDAELKDDVKIESMRDYFSKRHEIIDGMEPYPVSLRTMSWIKFCSSKGIREFDDFIYSQASLLSRSFEYHLMGNHLLENAFSLLFAAFYFRDMGFYSLANRVLRTELGEQVLADGGHFERSPMYHKIILSRLLESIFLIRNSSWKKELLEVCENSAALMLSWLKQVSFKNGGTAMVNDSIIGVAASSIDLQKYASLMDISPSKVLLGESGYRMVRMQNYECFLDVGEIGPDYIPGHAHSDTFSFELYHEGEPLIVDTGVSTYENNKIRHFERSTKAHNTVTISNLDQSEVWSAFRVARRARITELEEIDRYYRAIHDGYEGRLGIKHQREFQFESDQIIIRDSILGGSNIDATAYFHFPIQSQPNLAGDECFIGSSRIHIKNGVSCIGSYQKAEGFNKRMTAPVLKVQFNKNLEVRIIL